MWLVGDKLRDQEQRKAQAGVHLVPYSQFPPNAIREDCVYHSTPALVVPDLFENLHACEVCERHFLVAVAIITVACLIACAR